MVEKYKKSYTDALGEVEKLMVKIEKAKKDERELLAELRALDVRLEKMKAEKAAKVEEMDVDEKSKFLRFYFKKF